MGITRVRLALPLLLASLLVGSAALAADGSATPQAKPMCGVVEHVLGQGQLLDSSRTEILPGVVTSPVACGTWASVGPNEGSVRVTLVNGDKIQLSRGSFAQINAGDDGVVLFRGNLLVESVEKSGETQVLTPNGRARIGYGKSIVIYNPDHDETQLVVLEERATLENRFASGKRVAAKAGEATSLNFKILRTEPSHPKAVAATSLKEKFMMLPIDEAIKRESFAIAQARQKRGFPADLIGDGTPLGAEERGGRGLASSKQTSKSDYSRHPASAQNEALLKRFESRAVGGVPGANTLLKPSEKKKVIEGLKRVQPIE